MALLLSKLLLVDTRGVTAEGNNKIVYYDRLLGWCGLAVKTRKVAYCVKPNFKSELYI